jgi:twitching motility protein PilT
MARIDKLLGTIQAKGAKALWLEPGQQPALELANGSRMALLPDPAPAGMLELLANEITPAANLEALQMASETRFDYVTGEAAFQVTLSRSPGGIRIQAEPLGPVAPTPAPAPAPPPTIALDFDRTPGPPPAPLPTPRPAAAAPPAPPRVTPSAEGDRTLATQLFSVLLQKKGSDIHCSSFEVPIVRVNGDLEELGDFEILGPNQILEVMRALAPEYAWSEFERTHDTDFAYDFKEGNCRFRVNFFHDRVGPGFVCRAIPNEIPDPDRLGLPDPIRRLAGLNKGLVLVTGPTGSGKSTTLAAILDIANRTRNDHILTIEDPIEFVHPRRKCLVNQREVHTHTESFKKGLRAALREDPDIVLVGEMRDLETVAIALETAITGHLVFGTLHTSSAIGTVDRIVDQFPSDRQQQIRVMLADCLKAVISQALLKRVGGGRIAALESLFITPAISNLIREAKIFQIPSAMQTGRAYGQKLMNDALTELILSGQVEPMEAYIKCPDKESFMQAIKRANINFDPREGKTGE